MDLIIPFVNWLKGLSDGEATLFSLLVTGFCVFLGWTIRWLRKPKTASNIQSDSILEGTLAPSIEIDKVNAKPGGTAVGVNLGGN